MQSQGPLGHAAKSRPLGKGARSDPVSCYSWAFTPREAPPGSSSLQSPVFVLEAGRTGEHFTKFVWNVEWVFLNTTFCG